MSNGMSYIGRKECGCAVAFVVDDPQYPNYTAKAVADFIRRGYTVERVPAEVVGKFLKRCPHKQGELP